MCYITSLLSSILGSNFASNKDQRGQVTPFAFYFFELVLKDLTLESFKVSVKLWQVQSVSF